MKKQTKNKKVLQPNVVNGGIAIPLGNNYYYMQGRTHAQGGIDIGNNKNGLEVENGEVMKVNNDNIKVFSAQPMLNGDSPADKVLNGENPNKVFKAQERFKNNNNLKNDGTKKQNGGKYITHLTNNEEKEFMNWYSKVAKYKNLNPNPDAIGQDYDYRGYWKNEDRQSILNNDTNAHFTDKYKQPTHPTFSNESIYSTKNTPGGEWVQGKNTWLFKHNKFTARQLNKTHNYLNNSGEGYIINNDTIIPRTKKFKNGGKWRSSDSIRKRISDWEGASMKTNRPFDVEDVAFYNSIPKDIVDKLNNDMLDSLYSYSYNVGSGNFKKRVVPKLVGLFNGTNTVEDVQNSMYAKLDNKLRGLTKRRNVERQMFGNAYNAKYPKVQTNENNNYSYLNPINTNVERKYDNYITKPSINDYITKPNINFVDTNNLITNADNSNLNTSIDNVDLTNNYVKYNNPNYYKVNMNNGQYKNGGIYTIESKGKSMTRFNPSTGKYAERSGASPKALYGINIAMRPNYIETFAGDTTPIYRNNNTNKVTKSNTTLPIARISNNILNRITKNDFISAGANTIGNIASTIINNNAINKMKYTGVPVNMRANKLKTRININPQLDNMRESLSRFEDNINNNTSSSQLANARNQQIRLANIMNTNNIYTNKENQETDLINKDRLNQQTVVNENIKQYNNWMTNKNAFDNAIIEKRSENFVNGIQNAVGTVNDILTRNERRRQFDNANALYSASHPNVSPELLRAYGYNGIDDDSIVRYLRGKGYTDEQIKAKGYVLNK